MIGAWPELVALKKQDDLESAGIYSFNVARILKFGIIEVWIVFDAQFVRALPSHLTRPG